MLAGLGLADLAEAASQRTPFPRAALDRVLATRNPLAAASLADLGRAAGSGVEVTHPVTLRVRAPGLVHGLEDPTKVAHDLSALGGVPATEMEMLGALPADAPLGLAFELVRSVAAARPDLPLRALTAAEVDGIAARERRPRKDVFTALRDAGLAALSWRPGCGLTAGEVDLHRAAHLAGVRTIATVGTSHGRVDADFLVRLVAWARLAGETKGFLAATALPERTDGTSPLEGTSGTEDWTALALVRLAFGDLVPRITADWHVVGHKLGATMLSCGADDVIGTQAAAAWAAPTDDGPRPLNPDRTRKWIVEARRSPVLRDTLFRRVDAASPGAEPGASPWSAPGNRR
jgi:2-iminoacetate synthase ThiH